MKSLSGKVIYDQERKIVWQDMNTRANCNGVEMLPSGGIETLLVYRRSPVSLSVDN